MLGRRLGSVGVVEADGPGEAVLGGRRHEHPQMEARSKGQNRIHTPCMQPQGHPEELS